jgi:LPXTG-motif cell wall-anchored protein
VVFKFRDGEAKARLVVWNYADCPYTGDPVGIWFGAMLLSGTALLGLRKKRARR